MSIRIIFLLTGIGIATTAAAQSDFDLSQRWLNEAVYNPGAMGNSRASNVILHARAQWIGIDGAPVTQAATLDTYVQEINSAFGAVVLHDQIGYLNTYSVKLAYAYRFPVGERASLALGLSGGWLNRSRDIDPYMADDPSDPLLARNRASYHDPEFDFGVEYYGPLKIGASVRHLGFYSHKEFPAPPLALWAYAATQFQVSDTWSVEPCLAYNYRENIHYAEAGALFYFSRRVNRTSVRDSYWLGVAYRMHQQFAVLLGIHLTSQIRIGYSFDYGWGDLATISNVGTHELFLAWRFSRIFQKDICCPAYGIRRR
jgi:type IX secretion system PorP/SprF family membrane protein